jgi:hypothetical protein
MKTHLICLLTALMVWSINAFACIAFLESDYISGLSRVCFYDHLNDTVSMTVRSTQLCPQTFYVYH